MKPVLIDTHFVVVVTAQVLFILGSGVFLFLLIRWLVILKIKHEMNIKAPKVPTTICDKGHVFPSDLGLKLKDVPGFENEITLCPLCYDKNMNTLSKVPDAKTTDHGSKS